MNKVMYILVNKDLKGKMSTAKLAGQVAHAAATHIYRNQNKWIDIELYFTNNQTKIIVECPESKLLEYEKKPGYIAIRDAGHTELEPNTLTCVCAGIFDKDKNEVPKDIQKLQLLQWEPKLSYKKFYTGKELLKLIANDAIPENHLIKSYYNESDETGVIIYRHNNNEYDYYEREGGVPSLNLILTKDILYKIEKEELTIE